MQVNSNGIPIQIPGQRKQATKIHTAKILHNDFHKFNRFATMVGYEDGCKVTATVPMGHPDFKALIKQGYRVIEVWDKRSSKGEIA